MTLSGFWSYVHADDDAEGGRIQELARDIVDQYRLQTGDDVVLFLDRDSLEWGAEWDSRIEASIDSVAFFVPVLTPRYFQSPACRSEFQRFAARADAGGVSGLVLPILYSDPSGLASTDDSLLQLARDHQWADWTDLRFEDRSSGAYRRAVSALASRLVAANRAAEEAAVARAASATRSEPHPGDASLADDDAPGTLEQLADLEDALPELAAITENMGRDISLIGERTSATQANAESRPGGLSSFASRLAMMRALAAELDEPVTSLDENSREFAKHLNTMDLGVRAALTHIHDHPEQARDADAFFEAIRGLAREGNIAFSQLEALSESAEGIEGASREARPTIRKMRDAISRVTEGRTLLNDWVASIDQLT